MDYVYNTEYGDGDIPEIDKPKNTSSPTSNKTDEIHENAPMKNKSRDK